MKETEGNEHIDFFSQDTILDYIDGRLSEQDHALFEQQIEQDEMLQLAVEGIKGFYTQEQKDRPYLETLMTQSEENLKQALVAAENAPEKVVALNSRRRNIIGISIAACVALLMVFSLPRLLDNVGSEAQKTADVKPTIQKTTPDPKPELPKIADNKGTDENQADTGRESGDVTTSGNGDMLNRKDVIALEERSIGGGSTPDKKNIDGGSTITTTELDKLEEDEALPPPNKGFAPLPKKTPEQIESIKPGVAKKDISRKKEKTIALDDVSDFARKSKRAEKTVRSKSRKKSKRSTFAGAPRRRTAAKKQGITNATYPSSPNAMNGKNLVYRQPGKLYLWIYTDQENMEYFRIQNLGREIADNTGLTYSLTKLGTNVFLNQNWRRFLRKQKFTKNDVVWVYYLGKNVPTSTINKYNKNSAGNQMIVKLNNTVNDLSKRLESSKVALKILTVDNGNQSQPAVSDYNSARINNNRNSVPYTQQGLSQGRKSVLNKSDVYKKLFLGSSGIITILNSEPGRNVYQGVFTNNLVQSIQNAYWSNDQSIDWNAILKKTAAKTQLRSKQLGKPQKIQRRKMKVKKRY